jgi:aspartate racemase
MAKHIGIVAVGAEGAALCYRTICAEGPALMGRHHHPEITMHTFPFSEHVRHLEAGRWDEMGNLLLASARKLAGAGADFLICPDNTAHQALDGIVRQSPLPWLHIAEEVATVAAQRRYRRIGVLGTRFLMEGPVYPTKLAAAGVAFEIPAPADRERINDAIFDELVYGRFEAPTRSYFGQVIDQFKQRGCDAVVLGCTEIPLLISERDSALPTLDSTRILARAALRYATTA